MKGEAVALSCLVDEQKPLPMLGTSPGPDPDRPVIDRRDACATRFESNLWMSAMLRSGAVDGVWTMDIEDDRNLWINDEFWGLLGAQTPGPLAVYDAFRALMFHRDLPAMRDSLVQLRANPNRPVDQICRFRHVNGATVWLRFRGSITREDSGQSRRVIGAYSDISEQKRLEEKLLASRRDCARGHGELRAFAYGVSHDLKAPVNMAKMLIGEVLADEVGCLSADQTDLLNHTSCAIDRMGDLIEGVLEYAHLVGEAPTTRWLDLNLCLRDVLDDLDPLIAQSGGRIKIGPLPSIEGDAQQIATLFRNLIDNALRYVDEDTAPHVEVSGHSSEGQVKIRIADNGCGIEPRHYTRIFAMFARLHTRDRHTGNGLGLAVCERVARNHMGRIVVESIPAKGSIFTVILPQEPSPCKTH
ncbi:ATP-binding protein [Cognatishimia sp. F0-27]|uniref:sensor histidine kinase n=1 Tax=Cognatishimia sp. F0-27 TaxID=2816855 RepID=UPI001D0C496C|nr:PAS domain-containing sensor histidine kinase [Cognatishimia sp. F0-27]MCC1492943.1 PAS domain-containing protein [Cognatishimia sp. F0-27]